MKKKVIIANPTFEIFYGNDKDKSATVFISDIKNVFNKWLFKRDRDWIVYSPYEIVVCTFLADKDGMNCSWHKKDFDEIVRLCVKNIKEHSNRINANN
jgi:hypothetical protein